MSLQIALESIRYGSRTRQFRRADQN